MNNSFLAGVDIGGSHITAALLDKATGAIIPQTWHRSSVPAGGTVEEIIGAWSSVIRASFEMHAVPARIGIAMPGPFDYNEGICYIQGQQKYESLYGLNIKELLAVSLGFQKENIRLTNDAACFLQGEAFAGAAKGCSSVIGLTLGTGLGSATCFHQHAEDAAWWNAPFKKSIAEDYLSSRWFVQRYHQLTGLSVPNVKQLLNTGDQTNIQIVFGEFGHNLGTFLLQKLQQQSVELIVIGGNIAQAFPLFERSLHETLRQDDIQIPVKQAILGEQAALIGAATAGVDRKLSLS
ncbi:ROK family protein [Pseudoflavitalea rhizosphaerae]|uniref:ROK family protein n=1 Tax=Pseudoflavitalea rhizosphaerae TaxID=1884793 RepID=UPI000F8D6767|nr:ROK family protein [Pseudoflavitalea rhizosphaerae]